MAGAPADLDPVPLEVLKSAFVSVCNEMALAVETSAYSLIISGGRDFSATLYDASEAAGERRVGAQARLDR